MCFFYRPHLFDYKALLQKDPNTRLSHAFDLAFRHLEIEKLLDPEGLSYLELFDILCNDWKNIFLDINCNRPDKKSVMMYVMCFFQALQNEEIDLAAINESDKCEAVVNLFISYLN